MNYLPVALFISLSCFSQEKGFTVMKNPDLFKSKLQEVQKTINTIKGQFTQVKHLSFMQDEVVSNGLFFLKKQSKMRLDYTSPFQYQIVFNGTKVTIKDGKKTTKMDSRTDKTLQQLNDVMAYSMNGELDQIQGFESKYFENKEFFLVDLKPSEPETKVLFDRIKLYVSSKTFQVNQLSLVEKSGDVTNMKFNQIETNVPISDEKFVLR